MKKISGSNTSLGLQDDPNQCKVMPKHPQWLQSVEKS